MSEGVVATVTWKVKPELFDACVEMLRNMFPETRKHKGFRSIQLLKSAVDPHELLLIQEWDEVQDHQDYMRFRTETGEIAKLIEMTVSPFQMSYWAVDPLADAQKPAQE